MLQLKILRTKKRLSDDNWTLRKIFIALMGLLVILSFLLKVVSMSETYGVVDIEIPVLSNPIDDPSSKTFKEQPNAYLDDKTPMIILTDEAFHFGDVNAFSSRLLDVRNKFTIPHQDGSPNIEALTRDTKKWMYSRMSEKKLNHKGILVFAPAENIPMPIVIQCIGILRSLDIFKRVVLASGIR